MTAKPLTIAIVGYGTAGQAASILLSRDGHRVEVFERAAELGPVGAGFLLQPVGLQVLWEMGLLDAAFKHGRPVRRLFGETPCGRAVMDMRYAELDRRMFGLGMQRGALFTLLADAFDGFPDIHRATRIVAASEDGRHIRDEHGIAHGPYDVVLVADGSASTLRQTVGKPRLDQPYPWGALWCLLAQGDWPFPDELRQRYVAARKMIGFLPVGTRPDDPTPRLSFFWSLQTAQFEEWSRHGIATWLEEIAELWPEARKRLEEVRECSPLTRASYRDAVPARWSRGRLVLLGDAAHAMSPQLGQGVNMALLDTMAIRDALRKPTSVEQALVNYERQRRAHVSIYQFWSRWLTPLFQSDRDRIAQLRDIAFLPMGRVWGGRGLMLRVLSGTQHGWIGKMALPTPLLKRLADFGTNLSGEA
jgi:2-polyprenyl-6-methoxyphenol hydroxylase-like FAD-dependent oxidoreductase